MHTTTAPPPPKKNVHAQSAQKKPVTRRKTNTRIHAPRNIFLVPPPPTPLQNTNSQPLSVAQIFKKFLKTLATRFNQSQWKYFFRPISCRIKTTSIETWLARIFPRLTRATFGISRTAFRALPLVNGFFRRCDWLMTLHWFQLHTTVHVISNILWPTTMPVIVTRLLTSFVLRVAK